jgi:hypothetical protein
MGTLMFVGHNGFAHSSILPSSELITTWVVCPQCGQTMGSRSPELVMVHHQPVDIVQRVCVDLGPFQP